MTAPCKHYPACGGCQLQHLDEDAYRAHKKATLEHFFPAQKMTMHWGGQAQRRRVEFKGNRDGQMGFYEAKSHDLVPIEHCLTVVPEIQRLIAPLKELFRKMKLESATVTVADRGIELVIESKQKIKDEAMFRLADDHKIARIIVNGDIIVQNGGIEMDFSGVPVRLPSGAFVQPTAFGQQTISKLIDELIPKAKKIAEFFCGLGTYSYLLAEKAPLLAYEYDEASIATLQNKARIVATRRNLMTFPVQAQELKNVDVAVLNPPRAGAEAQCKALVKSNVKRVVMVSCNPKTCARDLKLLAEAGFVIKEMHGVDQFYWTEHIETVTLLERS